MGEQTVPCQYFSEYELIDKQQSMLTERLVTVCWVIIRMNGIRTIDLAKDLMSKNNSFHLSAAP